MKLMRLQQSGQSPPASLTGAWQARHEGGKTRSTAFVAATRASAVSWPHRAHRSAIVPTPACASRLRSIMP